MSLRRTVLLSSAVLLAGLCPLMAQNITYTFSGKLGPLLSGNDPIGANGKAGTVTAVVSTTLVPKSTTTASATYKLPAGAVKVRIGTRTYTAEGTLLKYIFPATGPSKMVFSSKISISGIRGTIIGTVSLANHSFIARIVKQHPEKFRPSPQTLTAATSAGGAGSQIQYSATGFGTTVLGLSGSASN